MEACYGAVTTLAFVAPGVVLPQVVEQLQADINPAVINGLGELEFGIYSTLEGTAFIDGNSHVGIPI
jgi:hypothetical protein